LKLKKNKQKQRVIRLNLDNTFIEKTVKRDGAFMHDGQNKIMMQPACVFFEKKRVGLFKKPRRIVLYVEGARNALKFKSITEGKESTNSLDDPMPFWTQREAKEFVAKETQESLKKHKPLTWSQFIIFLIPSVATLFLVFKIALSLGAL
jgi:hypothetical protein